MILEKIMELHGDYNQSISVPRNKFEKHSLFSLLEEPRAGIEPAT